MFNKKKIKKLEEEIDYLKRHILTKGSVVKDETSGYLILQDDAISIKIYKEYEDFGRYPFTFKRTIEKEINLHFKKGTEPKCDYIKQDIDGKRTYYKNDVEVKIK